MDIIKVAIIGGGIALVISLVERATEFNFGSIEGAIISTIIGLMLLLETKKKEKQTRVEIKER
ncbi:MAG: hypothetical protein GDA46_06490 [Bdellovibrionales bacterium]|nr:hypothetical protein [Bdellovibrionales bacterium]